MNQTDQSVMTISSKEEFRYRLNLLKEAIDADTLLQHLGFQITKSTPREVRAACKVHGGDNKTAFRMNKETKNWICFSHSCHEDIGYDVISLVMKILNLNFAEAVKYLENLTGVNVYNNGGYVEFKRLKECKEFVDHVDNRQIPPAYVTETYLNSFKRFRSKFFEKEENGGFPSEVLDEFEIGGGYVDKYGFQRDVIPIRNKEGELSAYSCRDITGEADEDYKYLLTEGFEKDGVLYNLHRAKEYMGESRTIIVVEGFKSVWKLYVAGYKNAVACMGSSITEGQHNLLYSTAFNVVLLLDGDEAGIKGTLRSIKEMTGKIDFRPLFLPDAKRDPADHSIEELREIIGGCYV